MHVIHVKLKINVPEELQWSGRMSDSYSYNIAIRISYSDYGSFVRDLWWKLGWYQELKNTYSSAAHSEMTKTMYWCESLGLTDLLRRNVTYDIEECTEAEFLAAVTKNPF